MDLNEKLAARRRELAIETEKARLDEQKAINAAKEQNRLENARVKKAERDALVAEISRRSEQGIIGKGNPEIEPKILSDAELEAIINNRATARMTFGKSISTCMRKYVDFNGRATRSEYWWFILFGSLIGGGALTIDQSGTLSGIIQIIFFLPSLSAAVRRLHDTNRSGWWFLISGTIIGIIPLIIWLATKGNEQSNDYGNHA